MSKELEGKIKKLESDFSDLANKNLSGGNSYKMVIEAMASVMINLGPHDDMQIRRTLLEGVYAEIAKVLGRDASK